MKKVIAYSTTLMSLLVIGAISNINYNNNSNDNLVKAFAQIEPEDIQSLQSMGEVSTIGMSNQSESKQTINWTGTIDVHATIGEAFKSKINVTITDAITTAQNSVGSNSFVKEAALTEAHNYLIYKVKVVDENMKKYKVGVDPGTGDVLFKKEITWYDEHKMNYGQDKGEKYGKGYN